MTTLDVPLKTMRNGLNLQEAGTQEFLKNWATAYWGLKPTS